MKKIIAILLLFCLCLPSVGLAETRTIDIIDEYDEKASFWKEHPDVKRNLIRYNWRDGMDDVF